MSRLPALAGRLRRALPWRALWIAAAVAAVLAHASGGSPGGLRAAAAALAVAVVCALDDPAAETIAGAPTPAVVRRLVRLALAALVVAPAWAVTLAAADAPARPGLTLELGAMLSLVAAGAVVAGRVRGDEQGGITAATGLLAMLAAAWIVLPERWTLFADAPGVPAWAAAHERWAVLLALGVLILAAERPAAGARARLACRATVGATPTRVSAARRR